MPIELSDADRDEMQRAALLRTPWRPGVIEDIYRAGLRAGLERAAKVCEGTVTRAAGYHGQWEGYGPVKTERTGSECAAAIRAIAAK